MIGWGIFAGSWAIATIHAYTRTCKRYNRRRSSRRRVYGFLEQEDEYKLTETITKVSDNHKTQVSNIPSHKFDNHYYSLLIHLVESISIYAQYLLVYN